MEHSDDSSGSDDELMTEGMHLQAQTKKFLAKLKLRLRKRKPEEPSANDTQQKKPKESQEEIKLALTAEGFGDDVITVIRCLKERNVHRVALITKLWEADKNETDTSILPELPYFSSHDRVKASSLLLRRLEEEKEETEIAAVLAVCNLVTSFGPSQMKTFLIEGGLIDLLVKIVNSHRDQADIVERGLFVASDMADYSDGKEQLIMLGIVPALEKIIESYSNNHNVTWAACRTCYNLAFMADEKTKEVFEQSKLSELLEQVKALFPADTAAHRHAAWTLEQLE